MPNIIATGTIIDATRRGRVHLTAQFDGLSGQESQVIKINTWGLSGALSAASNNRQLLAGNGNPRSSYNVAIGRIAYSISGGGIVNLAWQGTSSNSQFVVLSGQGVIGGDARAADIVFNPVGGFAAPGHTGNVVLTTLGFGANSGYTLVIDFKKDPAVYDQGQIVRPQDFNSNV